MVVEYMWGYCWLYNPSFCYPSYVEWVQGGPGGEGESHLVIIGWREVKGEKGEGGGVRVYSCYYLDGVVVGWAVGGVEYTMQGQLLKGK